nr:hypothetical protein SHINE37_100367 [Rhizobiaceae bacterium]
MYSFDAQIGFRLLLFVSSMCSTLRLC